MELLDGQRDDRRPHQDQLHVGRVLGQEAAQARRRLLGGKRVRAVLLQPRGRLGRGQTRLWADAELALQLLDIERVPALGHRFCALGSLGLRSPSGLPGVAGRSGQSLDQARDAAPIVGAHDSTRLPVTHMLRGPRPIPASLIVQSRFSPQPLLDDIASRPRRPASGVIQWTAGPGSERPRDVCRPGLRGWGELSRGGARELWLASQAAGRSRTGPVQATDAARGGCPVFRGHHCAPAEKRLPALVLPRVRPCRHVAGSLVGRRLVGKCRQNVGSLADSAGNGRTSNEQKNPFAGERLEAATGVEPVMEVLQTSALPLGYAASRRSAP